MTKLPTKTAMAVSLLMTTGLSSGAWAQGQSSDVEIDEIIVTGSPFVRSYDESITGLSILSGDELADRLASNIGETLKAEPGLSSTFFGAGASRPIVRGQGGDRVRVLINGIGSIDASSASPDHAVAVEAAQAERIEVLRGASLLRYGSSGSGGIINSLDGRILDTMPDEDLEGAVRLGVTSVDTGREAAASLDFTLNDHLVLHLDGTWRKADDYRIPGEAESEIFHEAEEAGHDDDDDDDDHEEEEPDTGRLENSFAESRSITGGLSWIKERGHIGFAINEFEAEYGIPGGHGHGDEHGHDDDDHDDDDDDDDHEEEEGGVRLHLDQIRIDVNGAHEIEGFLEKVQFFAGYADYKHTEFEPDGEAGTVFDNEGFEIRVEALQRERGGWKAAYGVHLRNREFSAIGEEAFVPPADTRQLAGYMFHEKEIGNFHVEGAARYEHVKQENTVANNDRTFDLYSFSGGANFQVSEGVHVGGAVFRTERAPTSEELFSNGPHLATSQFEVGDSTLNKETATGIEGSLRYRNDGYSLTVNGFYTDYADYIYEEETGAIADGLEVFQFVSDDATFKGFEVQGGAEVGSFGSYNVSIDGLAEYVSAKTDSEYLPRIPPLSLLGGVEADGERFKFRGEIDYAAKQDNITDHELPTDDYAQINLFATWKVPLKDEDVRLKFSVMNLFDADARQHASFLKDQVPLPGRNFRFSINSTF